MTMFKIFLSTLAAIQIDRLMWKKIVQQKMADYLDSCMDNEDNSKEIIIDRNSDIDEIVENFRKDLEKEMEKFNDKH